MLLDTRRSANSPLRTIFQPWIIVSVYTNYWSSCLPNPRNISSHLWPHLNPSATPCDPYSLPLANGVVGKLVLEACISPVSGLVASNWASAMQENFTSQDGTSQLVVQKLAGSYIIQSSQATCTVPSGIGNSSGGRKNVKGRSQTPPITTGTPLCYYWVDPKDNDPTSGCVTPSPPFPVVSSDSEAISVEPVPIKDVFA